MITRKREVKPGKRTFIRFGPDAGTVAWVDPSIGPKTFTPVIPGLVINESYQGCALVVTSGSLFSIGSHVRVQVGKLPILKAEVRWKKRVASSVTKVGIIYSE